MRRWRRVGLSLAAAAALALALAAGFLWWARPARAPVTEALFEGIEYQRLIRDAPRPIVIHAVAVDLRAPGIAAAVTPGDRSRGKDARARRTSDFLRGAGAQVAINGSFFSPFSSRRPWDFYPREGDPVDVHGIAIANGELVSRDDHPLPALCVEGRRARISPRGCAATAREALAGGALLLRAGEVVAPREAALHPRTAVGLDARGETLWLVVVDGRQRAYSEGVTPRELAAILAELGATDALNLDGGGSSTLVAEVNGEARVLNSPVHTGLPTRERPVANHLAIFARPALTAQKTP